MARRTDAEILADTAKKQTALTERMAKKADPVIGELQEMARYLNELGADPSIADVDSRKLTAASDVLCVRAILRIEDFRARLHG